MKQKILTTMTLVAMLLMPQVMKADLTEIYALTTTGALGTATVGETETTYDKGGVGYAMNTLETNLWTAGATDEDPWTIKGVGQYIKVTVANNFQAGDQILIKGMGNGSFRIFDNPTGSTSSDAYAFQQAMSKTTANDYTLTLAADNLLIGKNTFYLRWSSGSNAGSLYYIKVNQDPNAETYSITVADGIANGTVTVNATSARAGVEVTMTAIPDNGYELDKFSVKQGETDVEVNGNKFIMPAGNVVVSATFKEEVIPANAIYNLKTVGDFGTQNEDGTFTKDGIVYEKSSLNNSADTSHNPAWWRIANTAGYFGCILPVALQAGDQIVIAGKASSTGIKLRLRNVNAVTVEEVATEYIEITTGTTEETEFTYTVSTEDILVGKNKFYVMQSSTNAFYMKYVRVLSNSVVYDVTMADMTNGSVSASPAKAVEGATVTLTVTPDENYELEAISAEAFTDDDSDNPVLEARRQRAPEFISDIKLTQDSEDPNKFTFTMPSFNVIIRATFKQKEVPPTPTRTLTVKKQWTAFCSPETFAIPEGLKAYVITAVAQPTSGESGTITLKEENIIAAGIPMIIENTALDTQTAFEVTSTEGEITNIPCTEFKGSDEEAITLNVNNTNYVLKNGVFVRTTATKVARYSCFIEFDGTSAARSFVFSFDNGTTSIKALGTAVLDNGAWYNLQGVQVSQPMQKGIYIHNGKKMVVK